MKLRDIFTPEFRKTHKLNCVSCDSVINWDTLITGGDLVKWVPCPYCKSSVIEFKEKP